MNKIIFKKGFSKISNKRGFLTLEQLTDKIKGVSSNEINAVYLV